MLTATIFTPSDLIDLFSAYGRGDQFSRTGFAILFEYLSDLSEDMGEDIKLDPIGICCEWTEYADEDEACEAYGMDEEELRDNTIVLDTYASGASGTNVLVLDF